MPVTPRALLALLIALATAAPAAADDGAPARRFELSGLAARIFAADSAGGDRVSGSALGLRAGLELDLLPRPWFVRAEALWLHDPREYGTDAVTVATGLDTFGLPLAAGYAWDLAGWRLSPYVAAGPTLVRTSVTYRVDDPLADGEVADDVASLDPGAIYAAGARVDLLLDGPFALAFRAEGLGLRRGVADDLALAGSLGLLF